MTLKRMSEFKRDDYSYISPDGDEWEITIVQTSDRKYVEIKQNNEDAVQWDVEMLLDIADAVRSATQKSVKSKSHKLQKPHVIDRREQEGNNLTPSDMIQASVEKSMEKINSVDSSVPVQSFSPVKRDLAAELEERKTKPRGSADPEKVIAPSGVKRS